MVKWKLLVRNEMCTALSGVKVKGFVHHGLAFLLTHSLLPILALSVNTA